MPPAAAAAPAQTAASKACHEIFLGGDIWVTLFQVISSYICQFQIISDHFRSFQIFNVVSLRGQASCLSIQIPDQRLLFDKQFLDC